MTEYVCGHSTHELSRLELQGAFFKEITRRTMEAAGLGRGMRVLDIGCGAGDVSLLAANLVGPEGHVLGIDRAGAAIAAAGVRAVRLGVRHVDFLVADVETLAAGVVFDALVGRFVLMHQPDPARMLRAAARHVRPSGIIVMIESHMRAAIARVHSDPISPTYDRIMRWMVDVIDRVGAHADMGLRLRRTFVDAGLPAPALALEARVEGGPDAAIYRYTIESLRSMLPTAERLGILTMDDQGLAALEERLREEVMSSGGVLTSPLVVSAWCRNSGS